MVGLNARSINVYGVNDVIGANTNSPKPIKLD